MTTGQIIGIIIAVAVILVLIYIFTTYNSFVKLKNKVEEAFSTMDVYLKKRWDLIPNIVSTVKGYAKHEAETLENVIKANADLIKHDTLALDIVYGAERAEYTETNINGEMLNIDVEVVK